MSHSESLAVSLIERRPAKCQFSESHPESSCHCSGSGWITACVDCEGSGWDKTTQAPCRKCNGYGGFSVPTCEGYRKPGVKCKEASLHHVNEHHWCEAHKPEAA